MDKKTLMAINGVLLVAVIFLFIKVFTMKPGTAEVSGTPNLNGTDVSDFVTNAFLADTSEKKFASVAFIFNDSLLMNYQFITDMNAVLQSEIRSSENKLQNKMALYQSEYNSLVEMQYSLTQGEIATKEESLMNMETEIQNLQMQLEQDYYDLQMELEAELYQRVSNFLKKYGQQHHYDYVMGVSPVSGVLYANESLDITGPVLAGLNAEYAAERQAQAGQ